jgi:hypothetical protein
VAGPFNIRNATRMPAPEYECRVVRSVAPEQPALTNPLDLLRSNTRNLVNYKKAGELGVTLVMLEPVLRQILPNNRRGVIQKDALVDFESELRDNLSHAQYSDYDIPLDNINPLALYGRQKQYLGLQLDQKDYRLVGDRAMVERYMRDNYDRASGEGVSRRFLARNLRRMRPHITLGEIQYDNLDSEQVRSLHADPSSFMVRQATEHMVNDRKEPGFSGEIPEIVFPEEVTLNGLRIYCQPKG